ncbi:L,D-transpeptidase family protein [[Clostridium] symbiosum]|uniref:L,D-transpeptidase family protein n=1 Tax=Clostridium symbiosum TaxID=1512 RepID=UPI001D097101|nr:L,D-transpeptidase family protein [[Clostridium] symbiosum]MCB6608613.1 L,D-transpeptidase family protein [[Clostridium] symbiosum]MCB6931695.1 L,D-transpeptidase family protein [[Clostridium] symbiosum]
MADMKKTAADRENDGLNTGFRADGSMMEIEEAQGELVPGEAVIEQDMEVEADMQLQAALEEKLKAEAKLQAALEAKREAEAALQAALEEKREAEAKLEADMNIPDTARRPRMEKMPEREAMFERETEPEKGGMSEREAEPEKKAMSGRETEPETAEVSDTVEVPEQTKAAATAEVFDKTKAPERRKPLETAEIPDIEETPETASGETAATATLHNGGEYGYQGGDGHREERTGRGRSRARSRKKGSEKKGADDKQQTPQETKRSLKAEAGKAEAAAAAGGGDGKKGGKGKKTAVIAACALAAVILAGGGIYAGMAQKYKRVFFPNTRINGLDASGRTVAEVKEMISSGINHYVLTIEEREGKEEQITGEEIGLQSKFDGTLEQIVTTQNPYAWLSYQLNPAEYTISTMIEYDEEALTQAAQGLECMDPVLIKEPENAYVSDYIPGQGYSIIPETEGTVVLEDVLKSSLADAIINLKDTLSLEEAGAYKEPEIKQDDASLKERVDTMNRFVSTTITYKFGDKTEVLNGDRTHEWLITDEAGNITVDSAQAAAYVAELAAAYNTSNKAKNFKTSYDQTIQVKGGTYGWKINQSEETAELVNLLQSGQSQEREPVYSQKAASRGENDYGNTYVEINLTAQHLYFYKDGNLVVDSDFVSGNLSRGWGTPAGTYPLNYKQRNAVLKGENYRTPVDYWMPFNGGIGMHDATWRGTFGGTIYKTNGSHGCINLPHSVAKKIYENISSGIPVICYNLAGTEKGTSAVAPPPTQAVAPTQPPVEVPTEAVPVTPPTEAPTLPPETMAPAGPGSDTGSHGGASGPGSEIG